jgi:hypothetical protein
LTSKFNTEISNQVAGIDAAFATSHFTKNKNLAAGGMFAGSFDKNVPADNNLAWRVFVDYPNDLIDHFIGIGGIGEGFNPSLGFLTRTNYEYLKWHWNYSPRWLTRYGFKGIYFQPWALEAGRTASTKEFEYFLNQSSPFGFATKSGETFAVFLMQEYERIDKPFPLSDQLTVSTGKYWMYQQLITANSFQGRKLWAQLTYTWGGFYSGRIKTGVAAMGINVDKHVNFKTEYTNNYIALAEGNLSTNELAEYVNYAFNPKLDLSFFVQWNSLEDFLLGNFRLHWIPKMGCDLYVVYNRGYDNLKTLKLSNPNNNSGAAKLVWRFVF